MKRLITIFITILLTSCSHQQFNSRSIASINGTQEVYTPGDIKISLLDPDRFRELHGDVWVLMDGGSDLQTVIRENTSLTLADLGTDIPDARGKFLRMSNAGVNCTGNKANCKMDPQDNRKIGSYQGDQFKRHYHPGVQRSGFYHSGADRGYGQDGMVNSQNPKTGSAGGYETRPKNIAVNFYVKVAFCPKNTEKPCL